MVAAVADRLRAGHTVVAFPEGTTWCGLAYGPFRPAMFQAAIDAGRPVQPLRLTYHHRDGRPSTVPAFVGDDTLLASIRRVITARRTVVPRPGRVAAAAGDDRRELAARCEAAVRVRRGRRWWRAPAAARATRWWPERNGVGRARDGYSGTVMSRRCLLPPVYLDHAATTPMHPAAIEAMTAVLATVGNASSLHGSGRLARRRMEESRETLAKLLGARPSEVIFTAGGTESDNLAVKGIYWARRDADPQRRRIVTTPVEHHAVLDAVRVARRARRRRGDVAAGRRRRRRSAPPRCVPRMRRRTTTSRWSR